jgi:tetratricopeptide (TPR) repeat protein
MAARNGIYWAILLGLGALLLLGPLASFGQAPPTLVPPKEMVSNFEARRVLARLLASSGRELAQAVREYRLLLQARPHDVQIRLELAQLLIREKNYPEASRELQTILRQRPGDPRAATALARIHLWTKNYPEAIRLFEALKQRQLLTPDHMADLARAYTWNRQYPQAIAAYQDLLRVLPRPTAELYAELADVYLYAKNLPAAVIDYRRALELDPAADAIRKKLALALSWNRQDKEALALLLPLQQKLPSDKEIALELVRVHAKLGRPEQAVALARTLSQRSPGNADLLAELGDLELGLGHAEAARDYYDKALRLPGCTEKLRLHVADQMSFWGDFYRVETSYREYLRRHPDDVEVWLKLAWALASAQRFEEAEGVYRRLQLNQPKAVDPWLGLVKLRLAANDLKGASRDAQEFLAAYPNHPEGLALHGDALLRLQRYPEALETFQRLSRIKGYQVQGLLGCGKALLKQKRQAEAADAFNQALRLDPKSVEARYYQVPGFKGRSGQVSEVPAAGGQETPMQMVRRAQLLAAEGLNRPAIECYQTALARDPQCFPARLGLAEILGVDHQFDHSIALFKTLAADFPGDSKIWISWARVLGWSKHYDQSLEVYDRIHQVNPADPVPPREMARTAAWGKMMPESRRLYASLWEQPVDQQLLTALKKLQGRTGDPGLPPIIEQLQNSPADTIYQGYEAVGWELAKLSASLAPDTKIQVEQLLVELLPAYKVQKEAYLESQAKWLAWNKRLTPALDKYQELVEAQPGNQEALFDYAQVECALGLCSREVKTYRSLLLIDPLHNLAGLALERQEIRSNPSLQMGYTYWEEIGRGQHAVSQIASNIAELSLDVPITCENHLGVAGYRWFERPKEGAGPYWADGHAMGVNGLLNSFFRYDLSWTRKYYENSSIPDRNTGHAKFWFNLRDYATLGLAYERTNEIYNTFGIQQGTQANNFWGSLSSFLTRKWAVEGQARYISFNDNNNEKVYSFATSYDLTDPPWIFRVKFKGEYRDTAKLNDYIFQGDQLVNIIHPYWTPQNYLGGAVVLEWRHDLSRYFFCGSEKHYYALRTILSNDTTGNKGYGFEGEWNYEFRKHWSVNLKGFLNRSNQWDANAAWALIRYQL